MTSIYHIISIGKECNDNDNYIMAISYSKEILENMIENIPLCKFQYCNYIIKENNLKIYSLQKIDDKIIIINTTKFNANNLYAFNKITTYSIENVLLDITGFDINELKKMRFFCNNLSENTVIFDTYYDEGIMNA